MSDSPCWVCRACRATSRHIRDTHESAVGVCKTCARYIDDSPPSVCHVHTIRERQCTVGTYSFACRGRIWPSHHTLCTWTAVCCGCKSPRRHTRGSSILPCHGDTSSSPFSSFQCTIKRPHRDRDRSAPPYRAWRARKCSLVCVIIERGLFIRIASKKRGLLCCCWALAAEEPLALAVGAKGRAAAFAALLLLTAVFA